ncbi:hypothetical protein D3C78_1446290 [compost metagenome]
MTLGHLAFEAVGVRGDRQASQPAGVLPQRGEGSVHAGVRPGLVQEQKDVQVRVEAVGSIGDLEGPDGALQAQQLAQLLTDPALRGALPGP